LKGKKRKAKNAIKQKKKWLVQKKKKKKKKDLK
jgi:hypothetical protein